MLVTADQGAPVPSRWRPRDPKGSLCNSLAACTTRGQAPLAAMALPSRSRLTPVALARAAVLAPRRPLRLTRAGLSRSYPLPSVVIGGDSFVISFIFLSDWCGDYVSDGRVINCLIVRWEGKRVI
jgi:hypothetical protein